MREKPINFSIKHPLPKNVSFCHKPSHPPSPIFQQQNNSSSILHKFTKWVSGQVGKISAHRDPDSPNGKFKPVATYRLTHLLCVSSVCSQPVPNTETLSHQEPPDDECICIQNLYRYTRSLDALYHSSMKYHLKISSLDILYNERRYPGQSKNMQSTTQIV